MSLLFQGGDISVNEKAQTGNHKTWTSRYYQHRPRMTNLNKSRMNYLGGDSGSDFVNEMMETLKYILKIQRMKYLLVDISPSTKINTLKNIRDRERVRSTSEINNWVRIKLLRTDQIQNVWYKRTVDYNTYVL